MPSSLKSDNSIAMLSTTLSSETRLRKGSRTGSRIGWSLKVDGLIKKYPQSSMLP